MIPLPPTSTLFPYTTLFRSGVVLPERPGRRGRRRLAPARTEDVRLDVRGQHLRPEEHTSELQSPMYLVCRLLLEKKNSIKPNTSCVTTSKLSCAAAAP